jgi:hypothetical protein
VLDGVGVAVGVEVGVGVLVAVGGGVLDKLTLKSSKRCSPTACAFHDHTPTSPVANVLSVTMNRVTPPRSTLMVVPFGRKVGVKNLLDGQNVLQFTRAIGSLGNWQISSGSKKLPLSQLSAAVH